MAVQRGRTWSDESALTDTGNADRPTRDFRPHCQKGKPRRGIVSQLFDVHFDTKKAVSGLPVSSTVQ